MAFTRKQKQQFEQFISYILFSLAVIALTSILTGILFNTIGKISFIGQETAQRIQEIVSISIPLLLIENYGLTLPILILIGIFLFFEHTPKRYRKL